jgi:hypothetical protein
MRRQKLSTAALAFLAAQLASGASQAIGADAQAGAPSDSANEIHASGITVSSPTLYLPAAADTAKASLITPGAISPTPTTLPAINPLSLAGAVSATPARSKPEISFMAPESVTEISTKFGTVHISPGSLVLVVNAQDALSVYDLHDGSDHAVYVEVDNKKLVLTPGKHVTLARPQCTNFAAANKLPFVIYTSAVFQPINEGLISFQGSYDVNSLILRYAPFRQLLVSKDAKVRHVAEKVLKTSAIMNNMASMTRYYQMAGSLPQPAAAK